MRARGRAGWAALCAAISVTCGRSSNQDGPKGTAASGVEVSIDPAAVAITGGGTIRFTATVAGTADTAVIWSTDAGTIDQDGIYTAPAAPGTFSVIARSRADPGRSAGVWVSITPRTADLPPGGTTLLAATVTGTADTRVIWTSDGGRIRQDGFFTAPQTEGTWYVTAQSLSDPTRVAVATLHVARP